MWDFPTSFTYKWYMLNKCWVHVFPPADIFHVIPSADMFMSYHQQTHYSHYLLSVHVGVSYVLCDILWQCVTKILIYKLITNLDKSNVPPKQWITSAVRYDFACCSFVDYFPHYYISYCVSDFWWKWDLASSFFHAFVFCTHCTSRLLIVLSCLYVFFHSCLSPSLISFCSLLIILSTPYCLSCFSPVPCCTFVFIIIRWSACSFHCRGLTIAVFCFLVCLLCAYLAISVYAPIFHFLVDVLLVECILCLSRKFHPMVSLCICM